MIRGGDTVMPGSSRTGLAVGTGVLAVLVGSVAAMTGLWNSDANLRNGAIPWAFGALAVGIGLILLGSYRCGIGRPARLVRWGSSLALVGLGVAAAFLFGTGILAVLDSGLLSAGDTLLSRLGTLVASVCTLLILPVGLLALSVAVLVDEELSRAARSLPLIGTLVFMAGPVLVGLLPDSQERTVLLMWTVLLGAVWAGHGLLVMAKLGRHRTFLQPQTPAG